MQPLTHGRVVQQAGQRAGVDLAGLAAAGTAIEPCALRVVLTLAAVTYQQNQRGQALGEVHARQRLTRNLRPGSDVALQRRPQRIHLRLVQTRGIVRSMRCRGRKTAPQQPRDVTKTQGLHQRER